MQTHQFHFFVDESGDLGFSERSSKHIVFALVIVQNPKGIRNSLKHTKLRVLQRKGKKMPELKFSDLTSEQRVRVLRKITKKNFNLCAIVLKKYTVENKEFLRVNVISRYLIDQLTGYSVYNAAIKGNKNDLLQANMPAQVILTVDQFQSKEYRRDFEEYLNRMCGRRFSPQLDIQIKHSNSRNEVCLQLADLCAGSIFQKYEYGNDEYYNLIKDKMLSPPAEYFKNKQPCTENS